MDANNNYPQIMLWDEGDINMDIVIFFFSILISLSSMALLSAGSYHLQSDALQEVPIYQQVPTQLQANLPEVESSAS